MKFVLGRYGLRKTFIKVKANWMLAVEWWSIYLWLAEMVRIRYTDLLVWWCTGQDYTVTISGCIVTIMWLCQQCETGDRPGVTIPHIQLATLLKIKPVDNDQLIIMHIYENTRHLPMFIMMFPATSHRTTCTVKVEHSQELMVTFFKSAHVHQN